MTCRTALCTSAYVFSLFCVSISKYYNIIFAHYCYFLPVHKFVVNIIASLTFLLCTLCTAARVITHIKTDRVRVCGVTSVGVELFLLLEPDNPFALLYPYAGYEKDQVAVYSTNDYRRLRHLNVSQYKPGVDSDMTSCVRRKCLYMSDIHNRCIHRYALFSSATSKWPVSFEPLGLSVTPNGNLLVVCRGAKKLVELSAESGEQVREISLQKDITYLWHGVQLANGQFVVCHGAFRFLSRVCMIDDDGRVTRSYGGKGGSGDGQLNFPRHLAVDEDSQLIFVADYGNDRVVVLSPTLEFVRYISEEMDTPRQLHLDQTTRRLCVAQYDGDVIVIRL